ncbi:GIY-YIG nuclease family protein [Elizabethkingia anophelis]|uniref:GIY-YIG nuclease family protein n=1 Tax=Elizabethkingia anophelis TaxID=1117645 RepID=UPI003461EE2B
MRNKIVGVYSITNPEGKVYIGQSINLIERFYSHKSDYKAGRRHCRRLHESFDKHGFENHKFEILLECKVEELNEKERHYQELYNSISDGLNLSFISANGKKGFYCKETKQKLSNSLTGRFSAKSKMVIDLETGIFYDSIMKAHEYVANKITYDTFRYGVKKRKGFRFKLV